MQDAAAFRDAARAWCDLLDRAGELDLPVRIEALTAHLVHLYALGLRLPPAPPARPPGPPLPWPPDWPGLGPCDDAPPPLSMLLEGLTSDLTRGLFRLDDTDDADALAEACRWWRRTFDARWGTLAVACLGRLHEALTHLRTSESDATDPAPEADPDPDPEQPDPDPDPDPTAEPESIPATEPEPTSPAEAPPATHIIPESELGDGPTWVRPRGRPSLPGLEPAPPTRTRTDRARLSPSGAETGVLGLRFEPSSDGLTVTAVHPLGPAGGRVKAGDQLLAIDGLPLRGRSDEALRAALQGPPAVPRTLMVARGAGMQEVEVVPVTPDSLGPPPLEVSLLVFDSDAFAGLTGKLGSFGVEVTEDPDQAGQVLLSGPPAAVAPVEALLTLGDEAGWWERLDR